MIITWAGCPNPVWPNPVVWVPKVEGAVLPNIFDWGAAT